MVMLRVDNFKVAVPLRANVGNSGEWAVGTLRSCGFNLEFSFRHESAGFVANNKVPNVRAGFVFILRYRPYGIPMVRGVALNSFKTLRKCSVCTIRRSLQRHF